MIGSLKSRRRRSMRKLMILAVGAAFALVLVSGVAVAKTFQCDDANCYGTNNNDTIREQQRNGKTDDIYARGGNDRVNAGRFTNDTDVLRGQNGNDDLISRDGDSRDVVICGSGNRDEAVVNEGDLVSEGCETVNGVPFAEFDADSADAVSEAEALEAAAAL
jgi:hypothetical protein